MLGTGRPETYGSPYYDLTFLWPKGSDASGYGPTATGGPSEPPAAIGGPSEPPAATGGPSKKKLKALQHQAKQRAKRERKKKAKLQAKDGLLYKLEMTNNPNISDKTVEALRAATIGPFDESSTYFQTSEGKHLSSMFHTDDLREAVRRKLLTSVQKRNVYNHGDALEKKEELLTALRGRPASQEELRSLAQEHGVTTTLMGKLLAGKDVWAAVVEAKAAQLDGDVGVTADGEPALDLGDNLDQARVAWARLAVSMRESDRLTNTLCKSRNVSLASAQIQDAGGRGETMLQTLLTRAGIEFTTDRDNAEEEFSDEVVALPDVKLKEPLELCDRTLHWIEAKNLACAPGAYPDWLWRKIKLQLQKYTKKFGPGAVLWTSGALSAAHAEDIPEVLHLRTCRSLDS